MLTLPSINVRAWLIVLSVMTLVGLVVSLGTFAQAAAPEKSTKTVTVDIAQNMMTLVVGESPVHDDGMPAYGNLFIVEGFIYPEGTLDNSNGIVINSDEAGNPVAEPEFPAKVIGKWICRGWFVGDGLHTQDEPWAITTQVFAFEEGLGNQTIVSEGLEIPFGMDAAVHRAITGGTGAYVGAQGEQVQKLIGINATQTANFRIDLTLVK